MYAEKIKELRELLELWAECEPSEMPRITQMIVERREDIESFPIIIIKLEREMKRFNTFREQQDEFDNILSLLKICQRMEIDYDEDIELKNSSIDDMIQKMFVKCENKWREENDISYDDLSLDEIFNLDETLKVLRNEI